MPEHSDEWRRPFANVVVGDLRDAGTLAQLVAQRPQAAIHTVALNHKQSDADPDGALAVNVGTVWSTLRALQPAGLKRWIYFSTQQVYGRLQLGERVDETSPALPLEHVRTDAHLQAELSSASCSSDQKGVVSANITPLECLRRAGLPLGGLLVARRERSLPDGRGEGPDSARVGRHAPTGFHSHPRCRIGREADPRIAS